MFSNRNAKGSLFLTNFRLQSGIAWSCLFLSIGFILAGTEVSAQTAREQFYQQRRQQMQERFDRRQEQRQDRFDRQQERFAQTLRGTDFGSGADRVRMHPASGPRCQPSIRIRLQADKQSFFANDQRQLTSLWPQIIGYIQQTCPHVQDIEVQGVGQTITIYGGRSSAAQGWTLSHDRTPLQVAIEELEKQRATFENTQSLDSVLKKHERVFGGSDTTDAIALKAKADARKSALADEKLSSFAAEVERVPETIEGYNSLERLGSKLYQSLYFNAREKVTKLEEIRENRRRAIGVKLLEDFRDTLAAAPKGWRDAAATVELANRLKGTWGTKIPGFDSVAAQTIEEVSAQVQTELSSFSKTILNYEVDWNGLSALRSDLTKLSQDARSVNALSAYIAPLEDRQKMILAELEQIHIAEIQQIGHGVADLEAIIDYTNQLVGRFDGAGAKDAAIRIRETLARRVNELVRGGYAQFEEQIEQLPVTMDSRAELLKSAAEYEQLETEVPAFGRYRELAKSKAEEIGQGFCKDAANQFSTDDEYLKRTILISEEAITLERLICDVAAVGNVLTRDSSTWSWIAGLVKSEIGVTFEHRDGERTYVALAPSKDSKHQGALVGTSIQPEGSGSGSLTQAEWLEFAASMLRPPPTGRPDANGLTDCDNLAADPHDPKKLGQGTEFNSEKLDFRLIERGLEACIAAVEQRPEDARQQYQLGRLLWNAGDHEQSAKFISAAAGSGYPAAMNLKATMLLMAGSDNDAFIDAYLLYKQAASQGYQPAAAAARELNPEGIEMYKELTPPTGEDVLSTLPGETCTEVFGVRSCVRFTGATVKDCMQMSATDFSCTWRPHADCGTSANDFANALFKMACSQTEDAFSTFRKLASGWQKLD